jgi:hypothetical protein
VTADKRMTESAIEPGTVDRATENTKKRHGEHEEKK